MRSSLPLVTIQVIFIGLSLDKHVATFGLEFILVLDRVLLMWVLLHEDYGLKSTFCHQTRCHDLNPNHTCYRQKDGRFQGGLFSNVWDRLYRVA